MSDSPREFLLKKLETLEDMPTLPVSLVPLLRYMEEPLERVEVQKVVDLISQDKTLAAKCLHMANSPLFGRWQPVESIRDAVVALGLQRMREIATSCSVITLMPRDEGGLDPTVFWEHSLGCALVCRHFARKIGYKDPGKAYLGGLLHDIGIVAHLWLVPKEFQKATDLARAKHIPLHEAELTILGITHPESGAVVGERWHLSGDVVEVIRHHHDAAQAGASRSLVAVVGLSDLLCRMHGLGHGSAEDRQIDFLEEPGFALLAQECPQLQTFDWARFTLELESYMDEVHRVVSLLYRAP